jgi:hypothetical protein
LAPQSPTQLVQNVRSVHAGSIVVEPQKGRVGHTGLLSQAIDRPTLLVKDFSKFANDHASTLAGLLRICQLSIIYELCFTYSNSPSKLAAPLKGSDMNGAAVPFEVERDAR